MWVWYTCHVSSSHIKYTKELLGEAVANSRTFSGVIRYLGLRQAGGTQSHITRKIREYGLNTSHFLGARANCGPTHKGGPDKRQWSEVLTLRTTGKRAKAHIMRRALIESGRKYQCESCHNVGSWNGCPLMLQVDHINRNWIDDRPENVRFMCPNCHSQQPGWCGSKGKSTITTDGR